MCIWMGLFKLQFVVGPRNPVLNGASDPSLEGVLLKEDMNWVLSKVLLDTKYVMSETFFPANLLARYWKTKHLCTHRCAQLSYTTQYRTVVIILPLYLQPSTIAQRLYIGGDGRHEWVVKHTSTERLVGAMWTFPLDRKLFNQIVNKPEDCLHHTHCKRTVCHYWSPTICQQTAAHICKD